MGRGLSDLQRAILQLAARNIESGELKPTETHLYTYEVMWSVYGFSEHGKDFHSPIHYSNDGRERRSPGRHHFDQQAIGEKRYQAAAAAISRAFRRLEERGLASRYNGAIAWWAGIKLTDEGLTVARAITVNTKPESGTDLTVTENADNGALRPTLPPTSRHPRRGICPP